MTTFTSIPSIQPKFAARVKSDDFKGTLTQGIAANVAGHGSTVGTAYLSQSSGTNSSNIVPGLAVAAETAGVGAGSAAWAAANPSSAGLGTTTTAAGSGIASGIPSGIIDQGSNFNNKKLEGPFDISTTTTGSGVGTVESGLLSQASGTASGASIAQPGLNLAVALGLPVASAAHSAAYPAVGTLATGILGGIPMAFAKVFGKMLDRALRRPS